MPLKDIFPPGTVIRISDGRLFTIVEHPTTVTFGTTNVVQGVPPFRPWKLAI